MDQLRRRMDRLFLDFEPNTSAQLPTGSFPRTNVYDTGSALVLQAEVPGLEEKNP